MPVTHFGFLCMDLPTLSPPLSLTSGRSSAISTNSQRRIRSATLLGTGVLPDPTYTPCVGNTSVAVWLPRRNQTCEVTAGKFSCTVVPELVDCWLAPAPISESVCGMPTMGSPVNNCDGGILPKVLVPTSMYSIWSMLLRIQPFVCSSARISDVPLARRKSPLPIHGPQANLSPTCMDLVRPLSFTGSRRPH